MAREHGYSKASRHRRGEPTRPSSHATSLDLGSADRVRRVRSPSAERLGTSGGGVASRLVLHFRVQLCAHQDDDNPDPGHETDDRPERAVSFVIAAEIGDVPREQNRCSQQNNRGSYTAAAQPAPPRLLGGWARICKGPEALKLKARRGWAIGQIARDFIPRLVDLFGAGRMRLDRFITR